MLTLRVSIPTFIVGTLVRPVILFDMKEHVYRISKEKVIAQSIFIWLIVATHLIANCFAIPKFLGSGQYWAILFINIVFGVITIPSVYIFFNYIKYSANKDFVVTYNSLKLIDRKKNVATEIISPEIERIELHQNLYPYSALLNLSPRSDQEYFCFIDKKGSKIIVTSYIMDITEFWTDSLTRRVNSDKLIKYERFLPLINE